MRDFLINAGMMCWTLVLCWMWVNVLIFNKDDDDYTTSGCVLTTLWWIVVIWVL